MADTKQQSTQTFETAFTELEHIVQGFERGDLDLEKGLDLFKQALQLADVCKKRLDEVENKVEKIKEQFKDFNQE